MAPQPRLRENVDGNKMDLSMCGLTEVPVKDIAAIKKATVLDLSNNQLTLLPPSFCSLTHLVELDLSKNMLRELPESFGNLSNLKRLDLYGNQLTHLPLSFCHLKALRWLDLKNNPLVPTLAGIAGPCGDPQQCQQCARNIVATLTQTAIKVEEDRKRLLEEKLRVQELLELEYEMKKKQLDAEDTKKIKRKTRKGKPEMQGHNACDTAEISSSEKQSAQKSVLRASGQENAKVTGNQKNSTQSLRGFLQVVLRVIFYLIAVIVILFMSSILIAAYDRKLFLQITSEYQVLSNEVLSYVLYFAKHVEYAAKHPTVKEMRSQLVACLRSILASILNIYKTICQEFPVYYDAVKSKFI